MTGPLYKKIKRKDKTYKDYLKEYEAKQAQDSGLEIPSGKIGAKFYRR